MCENMENDQEVADNLNMSWRSDGEGNVDWNGELEATCNSDQRRLRPNTTGT